MADKMLMKVDEVAEVLEVSVPFAYKLIRKLNEELDKKGCITLSGKVDRKYFYERFYGGSDIYAAEQKEEK